MLTPVDKKRLETEAEMRAVWDLRIFVVGGGFQYIQMFHEAGFSGAVGVEDADIVCFTGGEDVWPGLYNEAALPCTGFNKSRDERESIIYADALALKKPMIGICRGSQFLNVMNGGALWQDVNNHAIHQGHEIVDLRNGDTVYNMTSTHHQQMIAAKDAEIIALAKLSTFKRNAKTSVVREEPELDDQEVVWYPGSLSLCFQPHPEFRHGECRDYFLSLVDEFIIPACQS